MRKCPLCGGGMIFRSAVPKWGEFYCVNCGHFDTDEDMSGFDMHGAAGSDSSLWKVFKDKTGTLHCMLII